MKRQKNKNRIISVTFIIMVLIITFIPSAVLAAEGDETGAGTISLVPTVECIGVVASYSRDNNGNNSAILQYRESVTGVWITGMEMYADRANKEYRASVLGLSTNTPYEVRVTFTDADSVTGANPASGTVTTMNANPPLGTVHTYYVSTSGSDSSGDGSINKPWRTIQKAANTVVAGDTVYVRAGTYNEGVTITTHGSASNWITFLPYNGETVILDGTVGTKPYGFYVNGGEYIHIKGFTIQKMYAYGGVLVNGSNHVIVKACTISDICLAQSGNLEGAIGFTSSSQCMALENIITISSGTGIPIAHGVSIHENNGWGHVIRGNTITGSPAGTSTSGLRDGITCSPENSSGQYDCDFYDNIIFGSYDEDIQFDGNGSNSRAWGNLCLSTGARQGISIDPIDIGPMYIFRNEIYKQMKMGPSTGRIYLYHNTYVGNSVFVRQDSGTISNIVSRNNLAACFAQIFYIDGTGIVNSDIDYDDYYTSYNTFARWASTTYSSRSAFAAATGYETHGMSNSDHKFTNAGAGDYTLQSDSPDIDKGVIIPGFNDTDSPWPYNGSAPDIGAYEYATVEPEPPVMDSIGNKASHIGWNMQFTVSASDPNNDTLIYSASNLPAWSSFDPATQTFSGIPDQSGSYPGVHFEVTDGTFIDSEDITIDITENHAPELTSPGAQSANEGTALQFTISASDPDSDTLIYSGTNLPAGATINPSSGVFNWTPGYDQSGTYTDVCLIVTDSELSHSENIVITVNNVNRAPVLNPIGNKTVTEGQNLTFVVSASDPDGDTIIYSADTLPVGASFNSTSHEFAWFSASPVGTYTGVHFGVFDGALTTKEEITIAVEGTPSNPPSGGDSGGGGGSGGGSGGSSPAGITSLRFSQTSAGLMMEDVTAQDIDMNVTLVITKGTIVKNQNGGTVTAIRIKPETTSPEINSGSQLVSKSYDIEPSGTTFDASATLIFRYSVSNLPAGVTPESLYIVYWDPQTVSWQDIGGEIETIAGTVSTPITHLSTYALAAHIRPAEFSIAPLTMTTAKVNQGETVVFSTEVSNLGDLTGSSEISFKVDGIVLETKNITLTGGDSEQVSFAIVADTAGEHNVNLGDKQISLIVTEPLAPPAFSLSELNIDPLVAEAGDMININVLVQNTSNIPGEYNAILVVDDITIDTRNLSIDGGSSQTVNFSFTSDVAGTHMINIGNLVAPVEITPPARQQIESAEVVVPELESFNVSPYYNRETNQLVYARIVYKMKQKWDAIPGTSLKLTIFRDGQYFDQVSLLALGQLQSDGQTGELDYSPASGWVVGEYDFKAILYQDENITGDTPVTRLSVTPESVAKIVQWKTLGILIGSILAAGVIIMLGIFYIKRNTLRDYWT